MSSVRIKPVKEVAINGGLDIKYDDTHRPNYLEGIVDEGAYCEFFDNVNKKLKKNQYKKKDVAMLATGVTILPLIPFMYRNAKHKRRTRQILEEAIIDWNTEYGKKGCFLNFDKQASKLVIVLATSSDHMHPHVFDRRLSMHVFDTTSYPPQSPSSPVEPQSPTSEDVEGTDDNAKAGFQESTFASPERETEKESEHQTQELWSHFDEPAAQHTEQQLLEQQQQREEDAKASRAAALSKLVCGNCDEGGVRVVCKAPGCNQILCQNCDKVLHRKGERAKHERTNIEDTMPLSEFMSTADSSTHAKTVEEEGWVSFGEQPRQENQASETVAKAATSTTRAVGSPDKQQPAEKANNPFPELHQQAVNTGSTIPSSSPNASQNATKIVHFTQLVRKSSMSNLASAATSPTGSKVASPITVKPQEATSPVRKEKAEPSDDPFTQLTKTPQSIPEEQATATMETSEDPLTLLIETPQQPERSVPSDLSEKAESEAGLPEDTIAEEIDSPIRNEKREPQAIEEEQNVQESSNDSFALLAKSPQSSDRTEADNAEETSDIDKVDTQAVQSSNNPFELLAASPQRSDETASMVTKEVSHEQFDALFAA